MAQTPDDVPGTVSEPQGEGSAPEVKPARPLWPRPHDEVSVESGDETFSDERREPRLDDVMPASGNLPPEPSLAAPEPAVRADAERVEPQFETEAVAADAQPGDLSKHDASQGDSTVDAENEIHADRKSDPEVPVSPVMAAAPVAAAGVSQSAAAEPSVAADIRPVRENVDEAPPRDRVRVEPAVDARGGEWFARVAAAIVLLMVVGGGAMYAMSGGEKASPASEQAANDGPAPPAQPVSVRNVTSGATAGNEDLRLIRDHLEQLERRFARLETRLNENPAQNAGAADKARLDALSTRLEKLEAGTAPVNAPVSNSAPPANSGSANSGPENEDSAVNAAPPPEEAPITASIDGDLEPAAATPTPPALPQPRPPVVARADANPAPTAEPARAEAPSRSSPDHPVLSGWIVRDVYNGMAVIQSRRGIMEVTAGDELPNGNRVLAIRRLGGQWAVVTQQGIIAAGSGY
ncbi:hypothetical protein [Terrihabitans sp. B22-R8]|uniref:hypothetical protein n=1 Tax=Terrihabitans sp. B22-R8 TaxID=3425128 RepID=UPI00403D285A